MAITPIVLLKRISMAGYKVPDFNERTAAARAAKQAALDNLRNRPAPDPAVVAERQAAATAREAAAAERRAVKLAAKEAKEAEAANAAQSAAKSDEKAPVPAAASVEAPAVERPQPTDAELKAARDARYAARKKRKR